MLRTCFFYVLMGPYNDCTRMETGPMSLEVLLRPTLSQSNEPSDLRSSLSPMTRHHCTHVLVYTAPG